MYPLLAEFITLVRPPEKKLVVPLRTESLTGLSYELPDDYLAFIQVYGPGRLSSQGIDFMTFDVIMNCLGDLSYEQRMYDANRRVWKDFFQRQRPNAEHLPLYLSWGSDDLGLRYGWIVEGPPETWIAASEHHGEIEQHDCTMLELLMKLFQSGLTNDPENLGICELPNYWPVSFKRFDDLTASEG